RRGRACAPRDSDLTRLLRRSIALSVVTFVLSLAVLLAMSRRRRRGARDPGDEVRRRARQGGLERTRDFTCVDGCERLRLELARRANRATGIAAVELPRHCLADGREPLRERARKGRRR